MVIYLTLALTFSSYYNTIISLSFLLFLQYSSSLSLSETGKEKIGTLLPRGIYFHMIVKSAFFTILLFNRSFRTLWYIYFVLIKMSTMLLSTNLNNLTWFRLPLDHDSNIFIGTECEKLIRFSISEQIQSKSR